MSEERKCLECDTLLDADAGVETEHGAFCNQCYDSILESVKELADNQSKDINYLNSIAGGILGAGLGIITWWAVTFFSGYAIGVVAIVIGITVAKGMTLCNGDKRSLSLQIIAIFLTVISFFYAEYLVTRSVILKESPAEYVDVFTIFPHPEIIVTLLVETSDVFTIVFLGITVWQAWTMMKPFKLEEDV